MIPALTPESWDSLSACNERESWALVGDAAGFVDPVTGEGIYYALKSAELLAEAMSSRTSDYDELWRASFGSELRRAAEMQHRFYRGRFAGASIPERMVQFGRWHKGIREGPARSGRKANRDTSISNSASEEAPFSVI
jgi:flavin-dependent dehydrogenase